MAVPTSLTTAVLGTGRMGSPIAGNLLRAGFEVSVWNRTPKRARDLVDAGARLAVSPADAAASADVVLTMLADGEAVAHAMTGPEGALPALRPGSVWIQMATVGVDWTDHLAARAWDHGITFVDAPVSGSDGPARDGQLVVLASGTAAAQERVQPVFDAIGRRTLWLGPAGSGTRLKLVLNNWLASITEAMAETLALTGALGLDRELFLEAIADGPLEAPYAATKGRAMLAGDFTPGFALHLAIKDVRLALDAGRDHGLELPVTDAVARRWELAMPGHADEDLASVIDAAVPPDQARAA
ncbi:MAG: 3-hydroxyisobutyrate dehydrogenase [Thermoleophilaceae bacterium]|jgi:3-hydroxyisobutyrate dehydrogenase|nr:3-hydroxyisobutyrate dehydrogenase [Thermoleophilaceae bacterium]